MRRILLLLLACAGTALLFLSCGYSGPSNSSNPVSGVAFRAFVTQNVSSGSTSAGVLIVDAQTDTLSLVHTISAGNTPLMMTVTPNRDQTLVFSGNGTAQSDNLFSIINNASETQASRVTLPGMTQSFVVSPDSSTAYVAVPAAPMGQGQPQGAIQVINLSNGTVLAQVGIPSVRYLSISHDGNRILAFSDNSDSVSVMTPSNGYPVSTIAGFNRPVQAFFSNDDTTAYVVNCGANCGGTQSGVQILNLTDNSLGTLLNVSGAETATVSGTTMYLAGTPVPPSPCTGQQTQATTCGLLSAVELPTMTLKQSGIVITDGYHDHIAMGANGQLFVGANNCKEIAQNGEIRGCLSIFNSNTGAVVIPPDNGDVSGLQPIANRAVVYLVQNGELRIYDTTTDKLQATQIDISGQAVDVKTVDH